MTEKQVWSAFKFKVTNLFKTLTFLVNNAYWCGQKTFGDSSYKHFSMVEKSFIFIKYSFLQVFSCENANLKENWVINKSKTVNSIKNI